MNAAVDVSDVERRLDNVAHVCVVDSRLLSRVIKQHRGVSGVVPHGRTYALPPADLDLIAAPAELGMDPVTDGRPVILVARPPQRELARLGRAELFERVLRAAYHARVHLELEAKMHAGALDEQIVRRRVERIGRATFEEFRAVFRHDDVLLPPGGDLEVYVEFAATFLELAEFAPDLLLTTFPGLPERATVHAVLAQDLDLGVLLSEAPIPLLRPSIADTEYVSGASRS